MYKVKATICALLTIVLGVLFVEASNNVFGSDEPINTCSMYREFAEEDHSAFSGMFFSVEHVVEEYEDGDYYCISYEDDDANIFDELYVDKETYEKILTAIYERDPLMGVLVSDYDYSVDSVEVFRYITEEEYSKL